MNILALTDAATYGFFAVAIVALVCLTWLLIVFRPKLPHINTTGQWIKIVSILIAASDFVLMYADKVSALPLPGWFAHSWPFVLGGATIIHQLAGTYFPNVVPATPPASTPSNPP